MMKRQKDSHIVYTPFKSEAVCASLLEAGIAIEQIKTNQKGAFRKSYGEDIEKISIEDYKDQYNVDIVLNRDSIYDKLPEGLFHQTQGGRYVKTVKDAVDEHKKFREEERYARRFFAPIEQMIFRYRIYTEQAEREALYDLQNGKLNTGFYRFWGLEDNLPQPEVGRLLYLMPYGFFIRGNEEATVAALNYILNKEVQLEKSVQPDYFVLNDFVSMPSCRLGIDTVLGHSTQESIPVWTFKIGKVRADEMAGFVEGAPHGKLLKRVAEVFIPVEIDVVFDFDAVENVENEFINGVLGYGVCI